jgi:hypothetical protein
MDFDQRQIDDLMSAGLICIKAIQDWAVKVIK